MGDDPFMLGALRKTAAFNEGTTFSMSLQEPYLTLVKKKGAVGVAPNGIDFEKERNVIDGWRKRREEEEEEE